MRITRTADGVGVDGPSSGRGAWLCRSAEPGDVVVATCLDTAFSRRGLARAWRTEVDGDLEREIRRRLGGSGANGDEQGAQ